MNEDGRKDNERIQTLQQRNVDLENKLANAKIHSGKVQMLQRQLKDVLKEKEALERDKENMQKMKEENARLEMESIKVDVDRTKSVQFAELLEQINFMHSRVQILKSRRCVNCQSSSTEPPRKRGRPRKRNVDI
jgi:DNA repair exonuclease SbcCD ATPase subunit